jgi:hypothetical protein
MTANGANLYVANSPKGDSVSQYNVGATGKLSAKTPAKVAAGGDPVRVAVNPPAIP